MAAGYVPTSPLNTFYSNSTPGTVASPDAIDGAVQAIVTAVNENYDFATGLISAGTLSKLGIINVKDYKASGSAQTTTGSITTGTNALTVASVIDFAVGQGINVYGKYEVASLQVTAAATSSGNVTVTLNGVAFTVAVVNGDTAIGVATKIRAAAFTGWTTGGTAGTDTVTFTSTTTGTKTDATYSAGTTGATGTMTTTTQGTADLITTINGISGTTLTLAANASTTVTSVTVSHDDTAAITNVIAAIPTSGSVIFPKGEYKLTDELVLLDNCTIFFASAKLVFNLSTSSQRGLVVGNNTSLINPDIDVVSLTDQSAANDQIHCPIVIGDAINGVGKSSVSIKNAVLSSTRLRGTLIGIFGDSSNVNIEDIKVGDSATLGRPITIHWGNTSNPTAGTTHPKNISIRNVDIGDITSTYSDTCAIFLNSCYNVSIENIKLKSSNKYGIMVYAGDYGFNYGTSQDKENAMKNIEICNASIKVLDHGYYVNGNAGVIGIKYDMPIIFKNIVSVGIDNTNLKSGIYLDNSRRTRFYNADASNHYYGISFGADVGDITFENPNLHDNYKCGAYVDYTDTTKQPMDIKFINPVCEKNGVGDAGSFRAGIYINRATRTLILKGLFGNRTAETYQFYGIRISSNALNSKIRANHVYGVIAGGEAYSLGSGADINIVDTFVNNTAATGITLKGGMSYVPIVKKSDNSRVFVGNAAPTSAAFIVGDRVENQSPTLVKNISHWECITAGSPGTWVAYGCGTGTTAQRPTLTANDQGYLYRDTTTATLIFWNGTAWV